MALYLDYDSKLFPPKADRFPLAVSLEKTGWILDTFYSLRYPVQCSMLQLNKHNLCFTIKKKKPHTPHNSISLSKKMGF